jgi:hypothetical protein
MGPGQRVEFNQSEQIRMNPNGSILTIEGRGSRDGDMDDEANLVHHAFAVLRYDVASSAYRISSYKDGQFLDVEIGDSGFTWGFDLPQGQSQVRFSMGLNEQGQWHETGEYSPDGEQWYPNLSMTLDCVSD